jgi:hypothetical protein
VCYSSGAAVWRPFRSLIPKVMEYEERISATISSDDLRDHSTGHEMEIIRSRDMVTRTVQRMLCPVIIAAVKWKRRSGIGGKKVLHSMRMVKYSNTI